MQKNGMDLSTKYQITLYLGSQCNLHCAYCHREASDGEGAYADITVFNPDTVIDKGTFTDPTQYPEGIEYVMVNGVFEVAGGKYTGRRNGTVLRKKGKEVVK